ncbi:MULTISPECIES: MoxR family ATPase [Rhodomicrobium]|uniref:AAA family ATPase n=1 Tax=Rhodomicrobium TaxID=1068 RepID=UPI000B4B4902|nr:MULTISPECIES: MoxR family ATPase [Rhodomicrobium]
MQLENAPHGAAMSLEEARESALAFEQMLERVIIGQPRAIRLLIIAVFARGHVLLEGDVGVGKTTLLRAAARLIGGAFERVEGSVDLMPGDLLYHAFIDTDGKPRVEYGPAIRHGGDLAIFFFNEINRARPQVHSLLLRIMTERSTSAFNTEFAFPFLQVFADRNRIEREETFELPAAARDRFFMEVGISAPADPELRRRLIFDTVFHDTDALVGTLPNGLIDYRALPAIARAIQLAVRSSAAIESYTLSLWQGLARPQEVGIALDGVDMNRLILGGASPRGMAYLVQAARVQAWLEGRAMIVPEDIQAVFFEVIAHRIFLDPIYELRRDAIIGALVPAVLASVAAP